MVVVAAGFLRELDSLAVVVAAARPQAVVVGMAIHQLHLHHKETMGAVVLAQDLQITVLPEVAGLALLDKTE
jgi:uncharacterized membrane protein